ncbi:MAG: hypothetical protein H7Y39_01995 [Nitrospiraceae bacterium]|nr:hypothetical protein [Nitrospiraceae bacterium]
MANSSFAVGIRYINLEKQLSCREDLAQQGYQIRAIMKTGGHGEWDM